MDALVERVNLLKTCRIRDIVDARLKEFQENRQDSDKIFSELCFCICTANNSAERGLRAQAGIDFCGLPEPNLRKKMREVVCRFYNNKTRYILDARENKKGILEAISSFKSGKEAREWIVGSISGLGYKEASHFLRNIGFTDVAIIDFHIIDLLVANKLIKKPNALTKNNYLKIERALEKLATATGTNLAELDLYLWYMETGKVLK